jgi:osmotically-inducible protein OsmY
MESDRESLIKAAGIFAGVLLGGTLGPILLYRTGLNIPFSSMMGSLVAGTIGYALARPFVLSGRRERDENLRLEANRLLREAGMPSDVRAEVRNSRVTLLGEVEQYSQRKAAARALGPLPGIAGVTNHIHLRLAGRGSNPEEVKQRIADVFRQHAELDTHEIRVRVDESHVILEGTVPSFVESSEAEELAWNVGGIEEVENHLRIAA